MKFIQNDRNRKKFICCVLFIFVILMYHLSIKSYYGDDLWFAKILEDRSLADWLKSRYEVWSSRIVVEAMLPFMTQHILIWKLFNILSYIVLAYSMYKLTDKKSLYIVFALILVYPLADMGSAGWVATYMNYYWPLAFGLYFLVVPYKIVIGEKVHWWEVILGLLSGIIGANVEQSCAVMLALLVWMTVKLIMSKGLKSVRYFIVHYVVVIGELLFILTAPGNVSRKKLETISWMQDFVKKNPIDKFIDGFESTMSSLITTENLIFIIFTAAIFVCLYKKTDSYLYRIIGGLPFCLVIVCMFGNNGGVSYFNHAVDLFKTDSGVTAENWIFFSAYVPLIVYGLMITVILMSFFVIYDDFVKACESCYIFLVAIASRIVIGFSPTLFISGGRTFLFCYVLISMLIVKLFGYNRIQFSEKELKIIKIIMTFVCIVMVINNIARSTYSF